MIDLYRAQRFARNTLIYARDIVRGNDTGTSLRKSVGLHPLMRDDKTYNAAHPDYHPSMVGSFPGRILHPEYPCTNPLYADIKKMAFGNKVPRLSWVPVLKKAMAEASTVPGFGQIMERKAYIENYLKDLRARYGAHYVAGWVSMTDAQFLYWVVRRFKPKTIVQTGVSNGLSSAFMMLALAKNGPDGKLYTVDLPHIFNPNDPAWTQKGSVYGVAIPEGEKSGWIVPDIYKDRFEVVVGDAKVEMPKLVDRLPAIDMFYHDSDHSYDHMMFEYEQAMRKLTPGGLVMADDVSWNASLWDFAEKHRIPAFNFRSTIGLAFFSKT